MKKIITITIVLVAIGLLIAILASCASIPPNHGIAHKSYKNKHSMSNKVLKCQQDNSNFQTLNKRFKKK